MQCGIFYERQLPRPWHERSEYELLQESRQQIELANAHVDQVIFLNDAPQNEDIVRLSPEELKAKMAAKEAVANAAAE
jgi:hypothetical protein